MTKKQLSKQLNISVQAITHQMQYMTAGIDYNAVTSAANVTRIEFTESGVAKLVNRDTKKGAKLKPRKPKRPRGRPRKNLLTIEKGGEV